ncbi:PspA-associated protein PspAB [Halobellus captivus]|uniref:PspA-associated protein PspAB n=1 Tax=Halobellus captivus TaxID=2592614 RepID=UPI0011A189BB|nr:hypothetical protein [Halobellus captivus]
MGFFDTIRTVLGTNAEADATRDADPEDLFGMSTAYVTMEADLGFRSVGAAALCFSGVDSTDFSAVVDDVETILRAGEEETGTAFELREDSHGWEWVILRDDDPEDLVTSVHFAADEFIERGYGSRILAAVFGFERDGDTRGGGDSGADRVYWIYSFRRGAYYPFAPMRGKERNQRLEFKLESMLDGELGLESDESYWYPMWPDTAGGHPWE